MKARGERGRWALLGLLQRPSVPQYRDQLGLPFTAPVQHFDSMSLEQKMSPKSPQRVWRGGLLPPPPPGGRLSGRGFLSRL